MTNKSTPPQLCWLSLYRSGDRRHNMSAGSINIRYCRVPIAK
jgi:hypothetical protein